MGGTATIAGGGKPRVCLELHWRKSWPSPSTRGSQFGSSIGAFVRFLSPQPLTYWRQRLRYVKQRHFKVFAPLGNKQRNKEIKSRKKRVSSLSSVKGPGRGMWGTQLNKCKNGVGWKSLLCSCLLKVGFFLFIERSQVLQSAWCVSHPAFKGRSGLASSRSSRVRQHRARSFPGYRGPCLCLFFSLGSSPL